VTGPGFQPGLTVARRVVVDMVRLAALDVPGVARIGRGGPRWQAWFAGPSVRVRVRDGRVEARLWLVARPGQALGPLAHDVREAVGATIERLLGLEAAEVTILVDGAGA
jgi:uncharacterized alkaline shock family protein YloU